MTDEAMMKKTIELGRDVFKDHIAEYKHIGENFDVLDFRKPGTICYSFRMVFDREHGNAAYISGDIGEGVIYPTCDCTLEGFAKCFTRRLEDGSLDVNEQYFMEKIRACNGKYEYDYDDFKEDLKALFKRLDAEEKWESFEDDYLYFGNTYVTCYDDHVHIDDYVRDALEKQIHAEVEDYWYCGRRTSARIILWLVAIRLAWEQLELKKESAS